MATNMDLMKSPRIRLHLNIHEPIELIEMTIAFQGLCYEFQNYIKALETEREKNRLDRDQVDEPTNSDDIKLYITKIENNCILAEIAAGMAMMAPAIPFIQDIRDINGFIDNIKSAINFFKKFANSDSDELPYTKKQTRHIKDMVSLIAKSKDGDLSLSSLEYNEEIDGDKVSFKAEFSKEDCRKAEQGAERAIAVHEAKGHADFEKVVMYFEVASRGEPKSGGNTPHRAIINEISSKAKRVYVMTDYAKSKIQAVQEAKDHNPLHIGFVVDVNVQTNPKGEPVLYRVVNVHETIVDD